MAPEPDPAPTGEPGPPTAQPKKGKVTGYTFPIDGEPDGKAVAVTRPDPAEEEPTPEKAKRGSKGKKKTDDQEPASPTKRFSNRPKPSEPDMSVTRLAGAFLEHLRDAGKSMATQFSYSMDLGIAKRELGAETRIADLTPERVAAFFESDAVTLRKNGKRKSQVTIDKTRRVLRMALKWAEEDCRIAKAPLPAPTDNE